MTRVLLWAVLAASGALCLWAGLRYDAASEGARVSLLQLELVCRDAGELAELRRAAPPESRRPRPTMVLATRVADVAGKAGLAPGSLQSVVPESESTQSGGVRRMAAKVTLDPLTLSDLGQFLSAWRIAEPAWTVSSIDFTPAPARRPGPGTANRPLRAVLTIETVFADKEGGR